MKLLICHLQELCNNKMFCTWFENFLVQFLRSEVNDFYNLSKNHAIDKQNISKLKINKNASNVLFID